MSSGRDRRASRREFLARSARVAAGAGALAGGACFPDVGGRWPGELASCVEPQLPSPVAGAGTVVEIEDPAAVRGEPRAEIDAAVVAEMLAQVLAELSGGLLEPWPALLPGVGPGTRVGLKVNCLNAQCPTSVPLVRALVASLRQGLGLAAEDIVVWDRRLDELHGCGFTEQAVGARVLGTVVATDDPSGPGYELDHCGVVNGKTTRLSRILTRETDLTLNVPVLKTHGVSGVTAALKNIYGVIDNPGEFHKDLVEALPRIYALPAIRDHIRLTVLDALIAVTVGGTSSPPDTVPARILASRDPLALDRHALALVNQLRAEKDLGLGDIDPAVTAWIDGGHALGLGAREVALIRRTRT